MAFGSRRDTVVGQRALKDPVERWRKTLAEGRYRRIAAQFRASTRRALEPVWLRQQSIP
jgi:hypothetical protein